MGEKPQKESEEPMAETNYAGIDYGLGKSNIDTESGIRYGVISVNSPLSEWFWESVKSVYTAGCPSCGHELEDDWDEEKGQESARDAFDSDEEFETACDATSDPLCPHCGEPISDGDQFGDEPDGNVIEDQRYNAFVDDSNDVWITLSPFYTRAQFCSPCAPGAGHLDNPCEDGPKTYCFGHDWFEGDKAPYPVFDVATDQPVAP